MKNRRGVMGAEMAKGFAVLLLVIAVLAFATIISVSVLNDTAGRKDKFTGTNLTNETLTLSDIGNISSVGNLDEIALTTVTVTNRSGGELVPASNYTVTGGTFTATAGVYANQTVNVSSQSYTWKEISKASNLNRNITSGVAGFFTNSGTFFTLLAIVIIILIVGVVVYVVSKFGGRGGI